MYNYLTQENIRAFIQSALKEDIGDGDHSTLAAVPASAQDKAKLIVKGEGILAGVELAYMILEAVDPNLKTDKKIADGQPVRFGDIAFTVEGKAQSILQAERLLLNCMQRMSGIATYTARLNKLIAHTNAKLLDTRKTTPNFRLPEKWAVKIGGGINHRFGLFDMIMIKDNHSDFAGGITNAMEATKRYLAQNGKDLKIVVETRNLDEVREALNAGGAYRLLLDNMSPQMMKEAVALTAGKVFTEASGGITEDSIAAAAESGVDFISVGALTHSFTSMDMSLKAFK